MDAVLEPGVRRAIVPAQAADDCIALTKADAIGDDQALIAHLSTTAETGGANGRCERAV